jgi:hypothetical protein
MSLGRKKNPALQSSYLSVLPYIQQLKVFNSSKSDCLALKQDCGGQPAKQTWLSPISPVLEQVAS